VFGNYELVVLYEKGRHRLGGFFSFLGVCTFKPESLNQDRGKGWRGFHPFFSKSIILPLGLRRQMPLKQAPEASP
jgi:hypothetical protein